MNNEVTVVSKNSPTHSPKAVEMSQSKNPLPCRVDFACIDQIKPSSSPSLLLVTAKKSNLSEPGAKKPLKRKVIWADEKQQALVQTSFFEIDETERANMHRFVHDCTNSVSIAKLEQLLERDLRQHPTDRPTLPPLPPLIPILLPSTIPKPTVNSHQRLVQGEREQTVLQALFIRSLLPENPREPDGDATDASATETKLIPLEDVRIKIDDDHPNKTSFNRFDHPMKTRQIRVLLFEKEDERRSQKTFPSFSRVLTLRNESSDVERRKRRRRRG